MSGHLRHRMSAFGDISPLMWLTTTLLIEARHGQDCQHMSGSAHTAQIRLSVSVKRPPPRTASMAALQKRVALLDRQQASRAHDDPKLGIGQANHVPMIIQKRYFLGKNRDRAL